MADITTTTQVDPGIAEFYDRVLLVRAKPMLLHDRWAQERNMPSGHGLQIKFRRYGTLPALTVPLVEGITPTGQIPTKTDITAIVKQYGGYIKYSDLVDLVNADPVLTEFAEMLGDQSGLSFDTICRDQINAGTNVYYAGSYADSAIDTRVEVNTAPTAADFNKVREIMDGNYAKMIATAIRAGQGQGTMPIPPAFWALVSHELQNDLQKMSGWLPAHQYPQAPAYPEEIGMLPDANIRFCKSQIAKVWADDGGATGAGTTYRSTGGSNVDVYSCLVFGQNAYGRVRLSGMTLQNIVKALGSAGAADALNQWGTTGWKGTAVYPILNDYFMIRCEFAATL